MCDHYRRLLTERTELLSRFQSRFHSSNCPSVAAAVQRFLESGHIALAADVPRGFGCEDAGLPFVSTTLPDLQALVAAGGDCFQVVVGASAAGREHYANVANIGGAVYYIDAFARPGVVSAPNDLTWLSWAASLEYTRQYRCRVVPT
jgi:hypothetical protein